MCVCEFVCAPSVYVCACACVCDASELNHVNMHQARLAMKLFGARGWVYKLAQIKHVQATHLLLSNNSCVHLLFCCSWFMCLGFCLLSFVAYIDSSIIFIELEVNLAILRDILFSCHVRHASIMLLQKSEPLRCTEP